ncbi:MAG: hypothetical protein ACJ75T_00725 [Solirubrobacterales bacterium]
MNHVGVVEEGSGKPTLAAWKLPLIVAAISTSIVAGFYLGGPGLGMAIGAAAAASILVLAARKPPLGPIVPPVAADLCRHVLLVLERPLESPVEIQAAVAATRTGPADVFAPDVLLLVPCATSRLDRWTSDLGPARERAEQTLALSRAALASAGIAATTRSGDEDLVQAVEDTLRSFPATEVVLVGGDEGRYDEDQRVVELRSRLQVPLRIASESIRALPAGSRRLRRRGTALPAVRGRAASRSAR